MLNPRQITTPKKPPDQKQSSTSLTVWITWNTHILQQKRYRILTSDLDPNSSRHRHLNEHQEDISPRKKPKACILEKKLNPARPKISNIESSESFAHHESTPYMYTMPLDWNLTNANVEPRQITTPKKPPGQKQSSTSLTVWITWNTHILQQKRYRILTSDLDPNSSRHGHLNEHQEDISPRKKPKACILKKKMNPARPKISNIESSESFAHHESTPYMYTMPLHWNLTNANVEPRQITTPKKPPGQIKSPTSLTVWITWNTHILQQKRYRILTSDLDANSSRHGHLNEHQGDILPRKRPRRRQSAVEEAKSLHFGKNIESSEACNQQHRIQRNLNLVTKYPIHRIQ